MPYLRVWIHFVWSTKDRKGLLTHEIRQTIFDHIKHNAKEKDIFMDCINGYSDHVHCLISLGNDQTISKVMQLVKGESSFWINKEKLCKEKFEWQDEFFGVSVSQSQVDAVRKYIWNQEEHHKKKTFMDEYNELILKYSFQKFG
jgi:putative transposase